MTILFVLLQAAETLPTNIWTVGGALALFAGVIAYLFKLYDSSQEKRLAEMKSNYDGQIVQLRNDLNLEKQTLKELQNQVVNGQIAKNNATLEKVEDYLAELNK